MDELHIIDPTERPGYRTNVHVETPGAALYSHRWRTLTVSDKARKTIMSRPHYQSWYKQLLYRIDEP